MILNLKQTKKTQEAQPGNQQPEVDHTQMVPPDQMQTSPI